MFDCALQRAAQFAQVVLDALTYGEGQFLDDGMESTALFLGDEVRGSRGRLLDSLKAAIETLVQLVRKPAQFPAERFETSLLSLARDFGQFAGRDGAEGGFDEVIEAVTTRVEGPFDQAARECRADRTDESPGRSP